MTPTGVKYYLDNYGSFDPNNGDWKYYIGFRSTNSSAFGNTYGAESFRTMELVHTRSFVSTGSLMNANFDFMTAANIGTIFAGGQLLPQTGLWSDNFSLIFLNKKETLGKSIAFTCLETGLDNNNIIYRGYRIGYTDSSKPFFEYYTDKGLQSYVANFELPSTHSISFVKTADSLSIGYYDFLKQKNNIESFPIDPKYMIEPSGGYMLGYSGFNKTPNEYFSTPSTNAVIHYDEFLYFTRALYDYDIELINSGFISNYVKPITGSSFLYSTGVTGYATGLTTIFSGITGYGITGTGYITDDFGIEYTGYLTGALTSVIYGTGKTPLTGIIQTRDYYRGEAKVVISTGDLKRFYNSGICFLKNITSQDVLEVAAETGKLDSIKSNQIGIYNSVNRKFKIFDNNPSTIFLNGQLVLSGEITNTGSIYDPKWALTEDYYNTGGYIDSLTGYSKNDLISTINVEQNIKLNYKNFSYTGGATTGFSGVINGNNGFVFFNGLKLQSGDYSFSGNSLLFNSPLRNGATGDLVVLDISGTFLNTSGYNGGTYVNITRNNPYYSHIYINGQKMIKDIDYLAISPFSYLNNSGGIFLPSKTNIYDDTLSQDPFWN